jgi:predicted amidophosphoribosyltransferase
LTLRLSQVDASNLGDHAKLVDTDTCLYVYEYTSGRDYSFSQTNSLINNLKKKPSTSSPAELRYKTAAIASCSKDFAATLNPSWLDEATLVPIPGSKAAGHPDFDDRMSRILRGIRPQVDVRELVRQKSSTAAAHEAGGGARITVEELIADYEIDETLATPPPRQIGVFDDVMTAGTHYRAMHTVLSRRFPGVKITGLFVARRVFPPEHIG